MASSSSSVYESMERNLNRAKRTLQTERDRCAKLKKERDIFEELIDVEEETTTVKREIETLERQLMVLRRDRSRRRLKSPLAAASGAGESKSSRPVGAGGVSGATSTSLSGKIKERNLNTAKPTSHKPRPESGSKSNSDSTNFRYISYKPACKLCVQRKAICKTREGLRACTFCKSMRKGCSLFTAEWFEERKRIERLERSEEAPIGGSGTST
ncbi:hypothetical protein AX17_003675 [Amanita inopinata Kibby_2008]|nr:hypothetical protein AX17_003675 [Amanita inopinata Kibby_2008]